MRRIPTLHRGRARGHGALHEPTVRCSDFWADVVPRYMDNLIAASARTGARMVVLDNVYMWMPRGRALNENTPMNRAVEGEIRAAA